MLWDWSIAVSITLSLILGAVIAAFFLKSICKFRSEAPKTTLEQAVQSNRTNLYVNVGMIYLINIFNSIVEIISKVFELPAIFIYLLSIIWSNRQLLFLLLGIGSLAFSIHTNGDSILNRLDNAYRCAVLPFVNNVVFSILHVLNYIYATYVPLWNSGFILFRQLSIGVRLILINCAKSMLTVTGFLKGFADFAIVFLMEFIAFLGFGDLNPNNNMVTNTLQFHNISRASREWLDFLPSVYSCSCAKVSPWIEAGFYGIFELDHVDWISHHTVNAFINTLQTFVKALPPFLTYPDLQQFFFHTTSVFMETGVLADKWLAKLLETFLAQIGVGMTIDVPNEFIGHTGGHFTSAIVHGLETFANTTLHTVLPFDNPTDVMYMQEVYSLDATFSHFAMFTFDAKNVISWTLQTVVNILLADNFKKSCVDYEGCIQYGSAGQCTVACEENKLHLFATDVTCPLIVDMEDKFNNKRFEFDNIATLLNGQPFSNGFKTGSIILLDGEFVVNVRQIQNSKIEIEVLLDGSIIDKKVLEREPQNWVNYLRDVYMGYSISIFDTVSCGIEAVVNTFFNTLHVVYDFSNTITWDYFFESAFSGESLSFTELGNILKRYLGPVFGRDYEPPSYNKLNTTWTPVIRDHNAYKDYLVANSVNRYNQMNFHEHVFFEMDKATSYLFAHVLEEHTFGKSIFNVIRLFPEVLRSVIETIVNIELSEKIGCGRNYNGTIGGCNNNFVLNANRCVGSNRAGCECNALLPLSVDNACQCIWKIPEEEDWHTTDAVANYCRVNLFEFNFIFIRRVFEGIRNVFQSFQLGNNEFPANPNLCLVELEDGGKKRELYANTEIFIGLQTKFGDFTMFPNKDMCMVEYSNDIACNAGDMIVKTSDVFFDFLKDMFRNLFIILGNLGTNEKYGDIDLTFDDEVCNLQQLFGSVSGIMVNLFNARDLSKKQAKLYFCILDLLNVAIEVVETIIKNLNQQLQANAGSGIFIFQFWLIDSMKAITKDIIAIAFTWVNQFIKAFLELPKTETILETIEELYGIIKTISDVIWWFIDFFVTFLTTLFPIGDATQMAKIKVKADARLAALFQEAVEAGKQLFDQLLKQFLPGVSDFVEQGKEVICTGLCEITEQFNELVDQAGGYADDYRVDFLPDGKDELCELEEGKRWCDSLSSDSSSTSSYQPGSQGGAAIQTGIGYIEGLFNRRRLLSKEETKIPLINKKTWPGVSFCDIFMSSFENERSINFTRLELAHIRDCVNKRVEGEYVASLVKLPYLSDIFYNWKKPFEALFHAFRIGIVYVPWAISSNQTLKQLRHDLYVSGYNATKVMRYIDHITSLSKITYNQQKTSWQKHKKTTSTSMHFVGSLHHLMFQTDWKLHTKILSTAYESVETELHLGQMPKDFRFFSKRITKALHTATLIKDTTFGYYDNLECPPDSLICMDCAILDNFIYAGLKQVEYSTDFYKGPYQHIVVQNFETYWDNITEYNRKYSKQYEEAINTEYGSFQASMPKLVAFNFTEWFIGLFEGDRSIDEISEGIANFINGNYTGELAADAVQLFPYDLYYYVRAPFDADCDDPSILYTSYSDRVGNGLFNVFIVMLAWELFQIFVMRFNVLASLVAYTTLSTLSMYVYYFTVYGFNPFCTGALPSMLINDFLTWLDQEVFLDCFCSYIPSLSMEACSQQYCDTCDDKAINYYSCHDVATGFTELNVIWHVIFSIRWLFPDWFAEMGNSNQWPLPYLFNLDGMNSLVDDVNRGAAVTNKEKACFYYHILTPITGFIVLYMGLLTTIPLIRISVKIVKEGFMIIVYMFLALFSFSRTMYD